MAADADRRPRGGGSFGFGDEGSFAVGLPQDDVVEVVQNTVEFLQGFGGQDGYDETVPSVGDVLL